MVKITIPRAIGVGVLASALAAGILYNKEEKFPPTLERQLELLTEEAKRYCNKEVLEPSDVISIDKIMERKNILLEKNGYNPDCFQLECRQYSFGNNLNVAAVNCYKKE